MNRRTVNLTLALVPSLLISGIGRAEAMAYRDARGQAMTDLDWSEIECRGGAYRSLKAAVGAGNP